MATGSRQVWIEGLQLSKGDVITIEVALERFLNDLEDESRIPQFDPGIRGSYRRRIRNILRVFRE